MAYAFFNASNGRETVPFEFLKENNNGTVWVRFMWFDYDAEGNGVNIRRRNASDRMLLTLHEDGYWYSKSSPIYGIKKGYKFYPEDTPRAYKHPRAIRADRAYLNAMMTWANSVVNG